MKSYDYGDGLCVKCKHSLKVGYEHSIDNINRGICQYHIVANNIHAIHPKIYDTFWCTSGFEFNQNWVENWRVTDKES